MIAVFENRADSEPSCIMRLERADGCIRSVRDEPYVRYVSAEVELTLASEAG